MVHAIGRFFGVIWTGLDGVRKILHLLLLLMLFFIAYGAISGNSGMIPQRAALLIQPVGSLVDQLDGDAYDRAIAELTDDAQPQTLVQDIVDALYYAKDDGRITVVHLELSALGGAGLSKLRRIAAAIEEFQESGKTVVASADVFGQQAYYLAAYADEVYMNPKGMVFLQGYGGYRTYYKEAIDKLQLDWNVFRVGTHKSFVEPFTRNDMSPEDRASRSHLIEQFWAMYTSDVELARGLESGQIADFTNNMVAKVTAAGGDMAAAALENGLLDELLSRAEIRNVLIDYTGSASDDSTTYASVSMQQFLGEARLLNAPASADANVAVITAVGEILDGTHSPGTIGGDSTAALLREARDDDSVRAVVLRVDSPGGSVFASEVIAHEVDALRAAGKPVVASMSSVAASGGYWISVVTDRIIANPATVTGSIGVFGMFPTYQRTLETLGITTDGVGTTPWIGQLRPDRAMSDEAKQLFQLSVNDIYNDFITSVAERRNMSVEAIDAIAQGQVWTGTDALANGLIDELGSIEDAIRVAAELAGIADDEYGEKVFDPTLSPTEEFVLDFLSLAKSLGVDVKSLAPEGGALKSLANRVEGLLQAVVRFNDPRGTYSYCFCEIS